MRPLPRSCYAWISPGPNARLTFNSNRASSTRAYGKIICVHEAFNRNLKTQYVEGRGSSRQAFPNGPSLRFNDASLVRGGTFDVKFNWAKPHKTHSDGRNIDSVLIRMSTMTRFPVGTLFTLKSWSRGPTAIRI